MRVRMRRILAGIGVSAALASGMAFAPGIVPGAEQLPSAHAVEGGRDALWQPWTAKVTAEGSLCTGSVIGPHWVLTAAHCVGEEEAAHGAVSAGARAERTAAIDRVIHAPGGADAALIHTASSLGVRPVSLPVPGPIPHQPGQFSGWGHGRYPLQTGSATVVGEYRDHHRGEARMFVTHSTRGAQEPGDSGGPFHIGPVLYGVLSSTGARDPQGHVDANYTAVDQLIPWIYRTIGENSFH